MNKLKIWYAKKLDKWIEKAQRHLKKLKSAKYSLIQSMTNDEILIYGQEKGLIK